MIRSCFTCTSARSSNAASGFIANPKGTIVEGIFPWVDRVKQENREGGDFSEELRLLRQSSLSPSHESATSEKNTELGKPSIDALAIFSHLRHISDGFGETTYKFLRRYRDRLNDSLVVDVLKLLKAPKIGIKFFIWAGRQIGYSHTARSYTSLLGLLGQGGGDGTTIPDHFLREIKEEDERVLRKLLNSLIRSFCRNGQWNLALEELGRLKNHGYKPSSTTYSSLIQLFLREDRLETVELLYKEMVDAGHRIDRWSLDFYMRHLCRAGRWKHALDLIEREELVPDTVVYTNMIGGLCEGSLLEEAMDFLNRMRRCSCVPNVLTYRILLCAFLTNGKLDECKTILALMMSEGCYPSRRIFDSLLHALCKAKDYSFSHRLLDSKMDECGSSPGYVSYNIFIGGICCDRSNHGFLHLAENAYNKMLASGFALNKNNTANFVNALCDSGKFQSAIRVVTDMMNNGFVPDRSTYSKVINFLCRSSQLEKACAFFDQMKEKGISPDVYIYTSMIAGFCKSGFVGHGRHLFDDMVNEGRVPNVVTYTVLVHACLKSKRISEAHELYKGMLRGGCAPNIVTHTSLIDGHCKSGNVEMALKIYRRMNGEGHDPDVNPYFRDRDLVESPNEFTYGALIDGLCKVFRVREAQEVLDRMPVKPNRVVFNALIDGFCKVGQLDEVRAVLVRMSKCGYGPGEHTYGSLVDGMFRGGRLDLVAKVLSNMMENACPPNVVIYTEMVDGLCKLGKVDEAMEMMAVMERRGCPPNVVTYTSMIDGLGRAGVVARCLDLFGSMCSKGCPPNPVTYRVLIGHCCRTGLLREAEKLLEEMKRTRLAGKDFGGLTTGIGITDGIGDTDVVSLAFSYRVLIERLAVSERVDRSFELFAELVNGGFDIRLETFWQLVVGLARVDRLGEALQLADSVCRMVDEHNSFDSTVEMIV